MITIKIKKNLIMKSLYIAIFLSFIAPLALGETLSSKSNSSSNKPAKVETNKNIVSDTEAFKEIEDRLKSNKLALKKYYGTIEQINAAKTDIIVLTLTKDVYSSAERSPEEKKLAKKASTLLPQVEQQSREIYASTVEELLVKNGMNMTVSASGNAKKQLRLSYALMSKSLVYKFQNEVKIDEQAKSLGFNKILYTNGFKSSLGETWSVNL